MPELLWTDALHEAPTVRPPRPRCASLTSVEVPRPQRIPLGVLCGPSEGGVSEPAPPSGPALSSAPAHARADAAFDPRASAALPLVRRLDVSMDRSPLIAFESGESLTKITYSAESSTKLWVREPHAHGSLRAPLYADGSAADRLPADKPMDRLWMLVTQALPLLRIDDSERRERRATAERVAIVVVGAMAAVMTMLAIGTAAMRFIG